MYYFSGIADEAARDIDGQIRAHKDLGWNHIELRNIDGKNLIDISEDEFERVCNKLQEADIKTNCLSSAIANWGKQITDPFSLSIKEAQKAIFRMKKLNCSMVRIMSYAVLEENDPEDQMEQERFHRLRELQKIFSDAGISAVHENCMNYGGMAWQYTLRLLENVPGLQLVFDTGNPVFNPDRSKPKPWSRQSSWEFYQQVKNHITHIHIKDCVWQEDMQKERYTMPGEGQGNVVDILTDLLSREYQGGFSIEPHVAVVFHDLDAKPSNNDMYEKYVEYGCALMRLVQKIESSCT